MRLAESLAPLVILALAGCPKPVSAPEVPTPTEPSMDALASPLPIDPEVRSGVLDNGLEWYVEVNREPRDRAVFRLAVDVGSVLEDDDQRGLAHFVEHMAFNGTEHFPGNELITYLEGIGTQFGPHINAHTGFDETVYKLTVPTDDEEAFDAAFLVLDDWASGITFDPEEIDKERGVVLEEWRTRNLGAGGRIMEQTLPLTYKGSPYLNRLPIGTEESLKTFEHDALVRFYDDWYRPDRMAVIVVGDIDPDAAQAKIEQHFSDLTMPDSPRERVHYEIPGHEDTLYGIVTDPEVPRASVNITGKHDQVKGTTHGEYRDTLLRSLAFSILNERLGELARQPEPPFLGAGSGERMLSPTEGASVLGASAFDDRVPQAYEALLTELRRAQLHGFGEAELERARARVLQDYTSLLLEKETTHSRRHAEEIVRVFTTNESMPGVDYEVQLAQRYVPEISLDEVNAYIAEWLPARSRVVTVVMPERDDLPPPTEGELATIAAEVAAADIEAPDFSDDSNELLAEIPEPGTIAETHTEHEGDLGFTGWTLSNGVRVWFKETDFKADEVRFRAFSYGGHRLIDDADYVAASTARAIMHNSGFGQLDANALRRWFAGKSVSLSHDLSAYTEGMRGSASPRDLEAMLQMMYASMTAPRFDADAFERDKASRASYLKNRLSDPGAHFADAYDRLVWPDDFRSQAWTLETLDQMDLDRSRALFEERFGPDAWTFVFVGNLPDDFEQLVLTYIGSLPDAPEEPEQWEDPGIRPTEGQLTETVRAGVDAKAQVLLEYHGTLDDNTWLTRNRLFALGDILGVLLREELREDRGGVYGVGVNADEWNRPYDGYSITIRFGCDPERVDELLEATKAVVEQVRTEGVDPEYVQQERAKNLQGREESLRTNGFWLGAFAGALMRPADPKEILTWDERNDALSAEVIQEVAAKWLDDDDVVQVVLLPEEGEPEVQPQPAEEE